MLKPEHIYFHILDSDIIGHIEVVITPIEIFNKVKFISSIKTYPELKNIFNELELEFIDSSRLIHNGILTKEELNDKMLSLGFKTNEEFKEITESFFEIEYVPKSIEELKNLIK